VCLVLAGMVTDPKSLYLVTPLEFLAPDGGVPRTISVKYSVEVGEWVRYQMADNFAENFNRLSRAH